jgi:hypothetical protein
VQTKDLFLSGVSLGMCRTERGGDRATEGQSDDRASPDFFYLNQPEDYDMSAKLFDIKELEADVDKEMLDEHVKEAKKRLISKRREVNHAEQIVRNLEREYQLLLLEIADDA